MGKLAPIPFGCAFGIASGFFYVGCVTFMLITPPQCVVWISNSLLHGIDVQPIIRHSIPMSQALIGLTGTCLLGCVFGYLTAVLYNFGVRSEID